MFIVASRLIFRHRTMSLDRIYKSLKRLLNSDRTNHRAPLAFSEVKKSFADTYGLFFESAHRRHAHLYGVSLMIREVIHVLI